MPVLVANGAQIMCDMGVTPSVLTVLPAPPHSASTPVPGNALAVVTDFLPMANIQTFGLCLSPANPAVQAATTAASGVFTPAPCIPATADPWAPPQPVLVTGVPAFDDTATCQCTWAGTIAVLDPGQFDAVTVGA